MTNVPLRSALIAALVCACLAPSALAQSSSTLKKIGNAAAYPIKKAAGNASKTANKTGKTVQYPVRKAGENTSVAAHEATGKNSVIRRRHKKRNRVVTPQGKVYTMPQAKKKGLAQ
jgi:hypothetical protein